jgi:hypothetical protein
MVAETDFDATIVAFITDLDLGELDRLSFSILVQGQVVA